MTNEKRIDPLLNMETVGGERSTAPTTNPTTSIDVLGHKLGQELLDSYFNRKSKVSKLSQS